MSSERRCPRLWYMLSIFHADPFLCRDTAAENMLRLDYYYLRLMYSRTMMKDWIFNVLRDGRDGRDGDG